MCYPIIYRYCYLLHYVESLTKVLYTELQGVKDLSRTQEANGSRKRKSRTKNVNGEFKATAIQTP